MNIWVHSHLPAKALPPSGSFNWLCFFFGGWWALFTGTWSIFWWHVVLNAMIFFAASANPGVGLVACIGGFFADIMFAFDANGEREKRLIRMGYRLAKIETT